MIKTMTATISGFLGFNGNEQDSFSLTLFEALGKVQRYKEGYVCQVDQSVIVKCWTKDGREGIVNPNGSITLPD